MNISDQTNGAEDPNGSSSQSGLIPIGTCYFDIAHKQIFDKHQSYRHVRPKSISLLIALYKNRNRVMTKEQLLNSIWGDVVVTDGSLVQCVRDLRHCLNDKRRSIIVTVPKRGYMLNLRG